MTDHRQKDLFGSPQPDLFGDLPPSAPRKVFRVDPEDIRFRLEQFVEELRALEVWPWEKVLVDRLHTMTWPNLFEMLQNPQEATEWKRLLETEASRLDKATGWRS